MTNLMQRVITALSALALIGGMGCASTTMHITERANMPKYENTHARPVDVLQEGDPVSGPYQILGKTFIYRRKSTRLGASTGEKSLMETLKVRAADMGADAILGFRSSTVSDVNYESGFQRWASALTVKLLDQQSEDSQEQSDFIVTIQPVLDTQQTIPDVYKHDETARQIARYHLENLGYYAVLSSNVMVTLADIEAMNPYELKQLGDERAALLLLLAFEGSEPTTGGQSVLMKARLISKETKEVLWEHADVGSFQVSNPLTGGCLMAAIEAAIKDEQKEALYPALQNVFEHLSPHERRVEIEEPGSK